MSDFVGITGEFRKPRWADAFRLPTRGMPGLMLGKLTAGNDSEFDECSDTHPAALRPPIMPLLPSVSNDKPDNVPRSRSEPPPLLLRSGRDAMSYKFKSCVEEQNG